MSKSPGLLAALLASGFLRFERWAWIGSVLYLAATGWSAYLTFRRTGLAAMYEAMGYPSEQIQLMETMGLMRSFPSLVLVSFLAVLLFFLWLGRYFFGRSA